jgi:hypothetical protein
MAASLVDTSLPTAANPVSQQIPSAKEEYSVMKHEGEWSSAAVTPLTAFSPAWANPATTSNFNAMPQRQAATSFAPPALPQQQPPTLQDRSHHSSTASRTYSSRGGSDARSVYSSATSMTRTTVVFATPAKYTPIVWGILALPLVAVLVSLFMLYPRIEYRHSATAWALGWSLLLIFVVYMSILPQEVDVRSNGTVGVKTVLLTFHVDGVVRAYQAGVGREDFLRPRIRFGTSMKQQVILRRNHGKWDVVVSPQDLDGFLKAVEEMVKEHGEGADNDADREMIGVENVVVPSKDRPNLALTSTSEYPAIV